MVPMSIEKSKLGRLLKSDKMKIITQRIEWRRVEEYS